VVIVDVALGAWLEGHVVDGGREETVHRVEYLFRQHTVPFSRESAHINPFFTVECNRQTSPHLLCRAVTQLLKGLLEHCVSMNRYP